MIITKRKIPDSLYEWSPILLMSDFHLGSPNCDKDAIVASLKQARKRNARVMIIGDVFDAILSKDVKRYSPSVLDEELQRDDIINSAVLMVADLLEPYADLVDIIGSGNHEEAVLKHNNVNLIELLVHELNGRTGEHIVNGGYTGYVQYHKHDKTGHRCGHVNVLYHHGSGGSSPVTLGVIGLTHKKTDWDFDIYATGHNHHRLAIQDTHSGLTERATLYTRPRLAVRTGAYRKNYRVESDAHNLSDYSEASNARPVSIGSVWALWRYKRIVDKYTNQLQLELKAEV